MGRLTARATPCRVLLVIGDMHPRAGGPPRVADGSARALARAGVAVEIATTGAAADADDVRAAWPGLAALGVTVHIFPRTGPAMLGYSAALSRFVAANLGRFDVVHSHGVWELCLTAATRLARRAGVATLVSAHGMLDRWQMRQSRLKKQLALRLLGTGAMLDRADAILYGTQEEADEGRALGLRARAAIMPNGVDPLPIPDRATVAASLHARFPQMGAWTRTAIFFSRMHPKKGLDLLVEAFAAIRGDYPDAGLLAVAIPQDEAFETRIRARIGELGSDRLVLVTDMVGAAARAMFAVADMFALPSHQEGLSIAILEAAGAGLPVLITDRCHMPEIATIGAGVVVPVTVAGLADGLRTLLARDPAELAEMGARGAAMVAADYSWDSIAARLAGLYASVSTTARAP